MAKSDGLRRYLEAGTSFTQVTRTRANELVRELIRSGQLERQKAQDWVEDLVKMSRQRSEALISTVRGETRKQLKELGFTNVDDLAKKVAGILSRSSMAARTATGRTVKGLGAKKAGAKKAPAKKTAAKRAGAAKASAKKTAPRKAPAKKAAKRAGV
ncbi:MAG TPA: hypothetical protein VK425_07435 [Acidimicrobiales bacterium]|nr:hypothetical protein [Acidimicrobiales bacterium]